ncbi:LysR family transcriptional regulator [Paracoccus luteus]|uniref:LysR family transcriptional regulator n=1 Tax=Paracoccus luteus TaxID=2508543 RepID=UPI00106FF33A|nr:LysR family transcriptional regulator [Paracoccus luteus]
MQRNLPLTLKVGHLRLVSAIAAHGQIQAAAQALGLTQPAASRSLAELERLVGTPLFDRHPRGMIATAAGEILARRSNEVLAGLTDIARDLADVAAGSTGEVRIGAVTGPAMGLLVPAAQRLRAEAPRIRLSIDVAPSIQLLQGLESGALDFVLARVPAGSDPSALRIGPGAHERLRLVVRAGHPLAGRGPVPLAELAGYPWVIQDRGTPMREAVESALRGAGAGPPADVTTTASLMLTVALVAQSDALAAVAAEVARLVAADDGGPGAALVTLRTAAPFDLPPWHLLTLRHRRLSAAAQRMLALVQQQIGAGDRQP